MEQNKGMTPDAIIILSAGIVQREDGTWRSTTYEDSDAFGTLGGHDRVEAAAKLAIRYPCAVLVTTSHTMGRTSPSLAEVYANELVALGVPRERIVSEKGSNTTQSAVATAMQLANERGWKKVIFLSSEFHIPRVKAFYMRIPSHLIIEAVSSESILGEDQTFAEHFNTMTQSSSYRNRLEAEERGIRAIVSGSYQEASAEDKKERSM